MTLGEGGGDNFGLTGSDKEREPPLFDFDFRLRLTPDFRLRLTPDFDFD